MLYEFECKNGHVLTYFLPVSECSVPQKCDCGETGYRIMSRTFGYVQRECRYDSPIDGRAITSWAQRKDDLARNGCDEYDPGMKQDYQRRIKDKEAALDKSVDATVDEMIAKMPARKLENLESELKSGADANIVRASV